MTDVVLHFRLLAAALPSEEKRIRSSYMPTLVLAVALPTVVFVVLGIRQGATPKLIMAYGLVMAAYIAYLVAWYPRRMRRRLMNYWDTYDLEIGSDYLLRRQADIPDLRLQFDEVRAVEHF
jgi:membrane protein YdbS with pleckstrin-like domain